MIFANNINNFFFLTFSNITIFDTILEKHLCYSTEGGCLVKSIDKSVIHLRNSSFNFTIHIDYGIFIFLENSNTIIENCHFYNIQVNGSSVFSLISQVMIINSSFLYFNYNTIHCKLGNLSISCTIFSNGNGKSFDPNEMLNGAIFCEDCNQILINNSQFISIKNFDDGSAIKIKATYNEQCYMISNCIFSNNSAKNKGGVLYIDNSNVIITNNYFIDNSANYGGAIYFNSDNPKIILENNIFYNNFADLEGGAIKWSSLCPNIGKYNIFSSNNALYGNDFASFPIRMNMLFLDHEKNISISNIKEKEPKTNFPLINNISSGNIFAFNISIELIDHYGKVVKTLNDNK